MDAESEFRQEVGVPEQGGVSRVFLGDTIARGGGIYQGPAKVKASSVWHTVAIVVLCLIVLIFVYWLCESLLGTFSELSIQNMYNMFNYKLMDGVSKETRSIWPRW